jgi:hypothetical protein
MAFAANPERVDLCRVLAKLGESGKYAGKVIEVQGTVKPLMHGTYLNQDGCDRTSLLVLPEEIPNYKGSVKVLKDAEFESFEKARFNYQPDAPKYSAVFVGRTVSLSGDHASVTGTVTAYPAFEVYATPVGGASVHAYV